MPTVGIARINQSTMGIFDVQCRLNRCWISSPLESDSWMYDMSPPSLLLLCGVLYTPSPHCVLEHYYHQRGNEQRVKCGGDGGKQKARHLPGFLFAAHGPLLRGRRKGNQAFMLARMASFTDPNSASIV